MWHHSFTGWSFQTFNSISTYTTAHMYPYGGFEYSVKSGFDREPLKLHKQMISHFLALDIGVKICQDELCSSIRGYQATFLVKNTLFK